MISVSPNVIDDSKYGTVQSIKYYCQFISSMIFLPSMRSLCVSSVCVMKLAVFVNLCVLSCVYFTCTFIMWTACNKGDSHALNSHV